MLRQSRPAVAGFSQVELSRPHARTEDSDMRRLAPLALVLQVLVPKAVRAQTPGAAQQPTLQQVVDDQLRRIEALEAQLSQLRREIDAIRALAPALPPPPPIDELKEPFVHAAAGNPPTDPDAVPPNADLPR